MPIHTQEMVLNNNNIIQWAVVNNNISVFARNKKGKTEIVLLDHGLYQEISQNDRIALSHFWKAIVLNNHVEMKKYALQLGVPGKAKPLLHYTIT